MSERPRAWVRFGSALNELAITNFDITRRETMAGAEVSVRGFITDTQRIQGMETPTPMEPELQDYHPELKCPKCGLNGKILLLYDKDKKRVGARCEACNDVTIFGVNSKQIEDPLSDHGKWIHEAIHDNLHIRALRSFVEKPPTPTVHTTTQTVNIPAYMMSGSMINLAPGTSNYVLRETESSPCEIIDLDTGHKISLTEQHAAHLARFLFNHFELTQAHMKLEDYMKNAVSELERHVAVERGWDLVKELLPAKDFDALQRNEWVKIRGSDEHDWLVKADGKVRRLADDMTKSLGQIRPVSAEDLTRAEEEGTPGMLQELLERLRTPQPNDRHNNTGTQKRNKNILHGQISNYNYGNAGWVFPDKLAALIKLIQHDAHRLIRKWGCGTLEIEGGDIQVDS